MIKDEDYKDCALPEEIEILNMLPEKERNSVFRMAAQHHCHNFQQWMDYLKNYVEAYVLLYNHLRDL